MNCHAAARFSGAATSRSTAIRRRLVPRRRRSIGERGPVPLRRSCTGRCSSTCVDRTEPLRLHRHRGVAVADREHVVDVAGRAAGVERESARRPCPSTTTRSACAIGVSSVAAVARASRPLPLFTRCRPTSRSGTRRCKARRAVRCRASTRRSSTIFCEYSFTCSSVCGGLFGSRPAFTNAALLYQRIGFERLHGMP